MGDDRNLNILYEGELLNEGGDRIITMTEEYGSNISSLRMDKLNREALQHILPTYDYEGTTHSDRGAAILL